MVTPPHLRLGLTVAALMGPAAASFAGGTAMAAAAEGPCAARGTSVVVVLDRHTLHLCEGGQPKGTYSVALGRGGLGKRREGDNRTPVGAYALGAPQPSRRFGMFIPVGYPTAEQRRLGFTGQAIGIHGPDRRFTWAGWLNTAVDWTQGCVAVKSDHAMGEVVEWVTKQKVGVVHLLEHLTSGDSHPRLTRGPARQER
jgi:hypothetical protein